MIQSHHLPTCDDVFEVLTRGPFPTGEHETDFPIERHLTVCHSCRELAEALRPATEMLSEQPADDADDSSDERDAWPVYLAAVFDEDGRCPADQAEQKETAVLPLGAKGSLAVLAITVAMLASFGIHALGGAEAGSHGTAPPVRLPGGPLAADSGDMPAAVHGSAVAGNAAAPVCSLAAVDSARASSAGNGGAIGQLRGRKLLGRRVLQPMPSSRGSRENEPHPKGDQCRAAKAANAGLGQPLRHLPRAAVDTGGSIGLPAVSQVGGWGQIARLIQDSGIAPRQFAPKSW